MNTMLPPPRDLPRHSRARIRAELERAYHRKLHIRFTPIISAVTAAAVVALAIVMPWGTDGSTTRAATHPTRDVQPTYPSIPGMTFEDALPIRTGCGHAAGRSPGDLYNIQTDQGGTFALLYTNTEVLSCTLGAHGVAYSAEASAVPERFWLPGDLAVDLQTGTTGGSSTSAEPDRRGEPGEIRVGGRISSKVAKVTYTQGDRTVDAALANGTFLLRILYPPTWELPGNWRDGIVRAYDTHGQLLGEHPDPRMPCYRFPEIGYLGPPTHEPIDLSKCKQATRW